MKQLILYKDWIELENVLKKFQIGYKVEFDAHNTIKEMLINIDTIGIYRDLEEN